MLLLLYLINISPFYLSFFIGEVKPNKHQSKKKRRHRHKAPLTRKQRIRQHIREKMLQTKAAVIEVCVIFNYMIRAAEYSSFLLSLKMFALIKSFVRF